MSSAENSLIIVPTVRNPGVITDYVRNAESCGHDLNRFFFLILTEDFVDIDQYKAILKQCGVSGEIFNEKSRRQYLRDNGLSEFDSLIPRKSHAETSFGLLYMWIDDTYKYGFMIDDDTRPIPEFDFFSSHLSNLNYAGELECVSSDRNWVNVLYQSYSKRKLYPRGYPYSRMGERVKKTTVNVLKGTDVLLSQGLWTNVPDLDAIRILMDGDLNGQSKTRLDISDFKNSFTVEKGNFTTVCSMNVAFRREIIPAFYQFPMDDNPFKIGRFDDIWSGIIAKRVIDEINGYMITGYPLCEHNKAPRSTFRDIMSEAPGYESNELISETVAEAEPGEYDILEFTQVIAKKLESDGKTEFIKYCGKYLSNWCEMLHNI